MKTSVIILVKNEAANIGDCLERVMGQQLTGDLEVIVIDSGSTDGTLDIVKGFDVQLTEIPAREFQHGRTRNLGASLATGDVLAFLTADALPLSSKWLANLTEPLFSNQGIGATYGRQIPKDDASYKTKAALAKIYPEEALVKRIGDVPKLGMRAYHMTNVTSAYLRKVWEEIPFPENLIACEDVGIARAILEKGYAIAYVPTATVKHSHNYGLKLTFQRYFDIGSAYQRMGLFESKGHKGLGIIKTGMQHAAAEAKDAYSEGGIVMCLSSTALNTVKYIGFALGRLETTIPKPIKKQLSLYSGFWDLK